MLFNMIRYITLVSYFTLIQNVLSYPTALYFNDLFAIFVANTQTLVCYINKCIDLGNYSNAAAVCSILILVIIGIITSIFVFCLL